MFLDLLVANYGLAGQYTVHTDAVYITGDAVARKQMREVWNIHAGDRFATVSLKGLIVILLLTLMNFYFILQFDLIRVSITF